MSVANTRGSDLLAELDQLRDTPTAELEGKVARIAEEAKLKAEDENTLPFTPSSPTSFRLNSEPYPVTTIPLGCNDPW